MSDNKSKKGKSDDMRINVNEEYEVQYWTKELGINADNLREVVADVRPMVRDVRKMLGQEIKNTTMNKKQNHKDNKQAGGITHKKDVNAGSGAFNQGSEQDPDYNDGTKVSDEEKKTGHRTGDQKSDERKTDRGS